jgi:hypothetical protein
MDRPTTLTITRSLSDPPWYKLVTDKLLADRGAMLAEGEFAPDEIRTEARTYTAIAQAASKLRVKTGWLRECLDDLLRNGSRQKTYPIPDRPRSLRDRVAILTTELSRLTARVSELEAKA